MPHYTPFDLHEDTRASYKESNLDLLQSLFPGTEWVLLGSFAVIFKVHPLPPGPWLLKVAGLACFITDNPEECRPDAPKIVQTG